MGGLFKYYPQCREHVVFTEVGSPLSFNHFIGSVRGEVYGMDCVPKRFVARDLLRPKSEHIQNLYLTGHDITVLGLTGAMMGGVLTASSVLGYGNLLDVMTGRNVMQDILNLEKI